GGRVVDARVEEAIAPVVALQPLDVLLQLDGAERVDAGAGEGQDAPDGVPEPRPLRGDLLAKLALFESLGVDELERDLTNRRLVVHKRQRRLPPHRHRREEEEEEKGGKGERERGGTGEAGKERVNVLEDESARWREHRSK